MYWKPTTFEEQLLQRYLEDNPGTLFLEVPVGGSKNIQNARRIDAVLIPNSETKVLTRSEYSLDDLKENLVNNDIHIIEAKQTLNRTVIGQIEVGSALFYRKFGFKNTHQIVLCACGEIDLEWYCEENNIDVVIYSQLYANPINKKGQDLNKSIPREDLRHAADENRQQAFYRGWVDAVNGKLYKSVQTIKTYQNIGNLFGWIYGDQDTDFRAETWNRYIENCMDDI